MNVLDKEKKTEVSNGERRGRTHIIWNEINLGQELKESKTLLSFM